LNAGLTQVLSDGTNTYLYGNGRISQTNSTTEYFLGDALGSVRQLADPAGAVTLTQSYAPYGDVVNSVGTSQTSYAYTGENRDANGLTYLRARYYTPTDGRFTSRDTWPGDYNRPLSLNRWNYVEGNPVNRTDPSGQFFCMYGSYVDRNGNIVCKPRYSSENITCDSGAICVFQLMNRAYYQESWAVIAGKGLELLRNDPALLKWQNNLLIPIMQGDSRYKKEAFSKDLKGKSITFGKYGSMLVDATYAQTWMVRAVLVNADAHAAQTGTIYINYYLEDTLDLRPDWSNEARTKSGYNAVTWCLGGIWHEGFGASDQMKVYAQWTAIINP